MFTNPNEPSSFFSDDFENGGEEEVEEHVPEFDGMMSYLIGRRSVASQIPLAAKMLSVFVDEWENNQNNARLSDIDPVLESIDDILYMSNESRNTFSDSATNTALKIAVVPFYHVLPNEEVQGLVLRAIRRFHIDRGNVLFRAMVVSPHMAVVQQAMKVFCVMAKQSRYDASIVASELSKIDLHDKLRETDMAILLELFMDFAMTLRRYDDPAIHDEIGKIGIGYKGRGNMSFLVDIIHNATKPQGYWYRSKVTLKMARVVEMFVDMALRLKDRDEANNVWVTPRYRVSYRFFGYKLKLLRDMVQRIDNSFHLDGMDKILMSAIGNKIHSFIEQMEEERGIHHERKKRRRIERESTLTDTTHVDS